MSAISPSSVLSAEVNTRLLPIPTGAPPASSPPPGPVYATPIVTYGNNTCESFHAGGSCTDILTPFSPHLLTNLSRSVQTEATGSVEQILFGLQDFKAPEHCFLAAIPLLCRYSFPTCDPAYEQPTYQPICRRDCVVVRDFLCREAWQAMLMLLSLLNFDYLDTPNCDPLEDTEGGDSPMCIGTLNKDSIPLPLPSGPDCYHGLGRGYEGTVNTTESGIPCQPWSDATPHQHLLAYENYPELSGRHNHCRNPGERGERPWCFTSDRSVRWEYCNVPQCAPGPTCVPHSENVCRTVGTIGMDWVYIDTSRNNPERLLSSMANVVRHINTSGEYSPACAAILEEYVCVSNFPSCDLSHTSPRAIMPCRQFCDRVRGVCGEEIRGLSSFTSLLREVTVNFTCEGLPLPDAGSAPECYEQRGVASPTLDQPTHCYNESDRGVSYRGDVSVTVSGKTCQAWVIQAPHPHSITPLDRPELEGNNFCRNPDGRGLSPWCYTTDADTRWEYCDIPLCNSLLPLYVYVIIGVCAPTLLLCVVLVIAMCCHFCCCTKRKSLRNEPLESIITGKNYIKKLPDDSPTLKSRAAKKVDITDNPLYAINPLTLQPMEYDGVQLPECQRENIFYIKDLGQGHFGVVVQAEVKGIEAGVEKSCVAVKVLKEGASNQAKKEFFKEATLMHAFNHPNILQLLGVCVDQEPLCMIFEFMELGDLNNFLRQNSPNRLASSNPSLNRCGQLGGGGKACLSTQQLVCIAVDVAAGLDYLAQNHFVHRDLATRNCLVSRNLQVKIADFGLSQDIYTTDYFKMGDTELLPIRWMPPEAILYAKFTTQSDIWSFGVVLWEIFSFGIQPYFSMTNEEVVHHVRGGNVMNCPDNCPREIYDLMMDCWVMDPTERPRGCEIHAGLQRWTPDLSATIQNESEEVAKKKCDYQNMLEVRGYASQSGAVPADYLAGSASGQFQLSLTDSSMEEKSLTGPDRVTEV